MYVSEVSQDSPSSGKLVAADFILKINDVNIKDDGNFINVTFSEGISKEDKDEIKDLITKLFTEINAEPVTIERSDSV